MNNLYHVLEIELIRNSQTISTKLYNILWRFMYILHSSKGIFFTQAVFLIFYIY